MASIGADDPLAGENQWPDLAGFREIIQAYEAAVRALARRLVTHFELALGAAPGTLAPAFVQPTTFLRLLHYPPQDPSGPDDEFGSNPHTDYGFMTILAQDSSGGLQVRGPDGETWLDVPPRPGAFVLNIGDIGERWSNGRLRSTPHRVVNRTGRDRYSIPYFFDPGAADRGSTSRQLRRLGRATLVRADHLRRLSAREARCQSLLPAGCRELSGVSTGLSACARASA